MYLRFTASRVQSPTASFTLEVFRLLVVEENFEVVKVALAIVTPRARENFLNGGRASFLLRHVGCSLSRGDRRGRMVLCAQSTREISRNGRAQVDKKSSPGGRTSTTGVKGVECGHVDLFRSSRRLDFIIVCTGISSVSSRRPSILPSTGSKCFCSRTIVAP